MDDLRAAFPVLERLSYLNAGTNGPVPRAAAEAVAEEVEAELESGRADKAFFDERVIARLDELRRRVARLLGCEPTELALTDSTTGGVNAVLSMLELGPGDEVLTSDEEHPGVLAPLGAGRRRRGFDVRAVPFDELPGEVGPRTRLVAVSHVSWITGRVLDAAAIDAPLLLDGAQGLGAVPVDVRALGCDFYAASGQKWLCGPNGLGYLYVRAERVRELVPAWPGYGSLAETARPLELKLHDDARRFDSGLVAPHNAAWALAALDVLLGAGMAEVHARAAQLADSLASRLAERGLTVAPRGASTLVSWESPDPEADATSLREHGVVVRHLPGRPYVRASVGAWSSEEELERLLDLVA
ncbi:MAG: aminotransferase class V-fold PLP-dependent enzyme [Thermoleophilaceae bacterium]